MPVAVADFVNQARRHPFDKIREGITAPTYRGWAIEVVAGVLMRLDKFEAALASLGGDVAAVADQLKQIRAALAQIDRVLKGELDEESRRQALVNYDFAQEQLDDLYERARQLEADCYR